MMVPWLWRVLIVLCVILGVACSADAPIRSDAAEVNDQGRNPSIDNKAVLQQKDSDVVVNTEDKPVDKQELSVSFEKQDRDPSTDEKKSDQIHQDSKESEKETLAMDTVTDQDILDDMSDIPPKESGENEVEVVESPSPVEDNDLEVVEVTEEDALEDSVLDFPHMEVLDREAAQFFVRPLSDGFRVRWQVPEGDEGQKVVMVQYRLLRGDVFEDWQDMSSTANGEYTIRYLQYSTTYKLDFRVVYQDVISLPSQNTLMTLSRFLHERHPVFLLVQIGSENIQLSFENPWWLNADQVVDHEYRLVEQGQEEGLDWLPMSADQTVMISSLKENTAYTLHWRTVFVDGVGKEENMSFYTATPLKRDQLASSKYSVAFVDSKRVDVMIESPMTSLSLESKADDVVSMTQPQKIVGYRYYFLPSKDPVSSFDWQDIVIGGEESSSSFTFSFASLLPSKSYIVAFQSIYTDGVSDVSYLYFKTSAL
ncbi:MAG: hypothetical protein OXC44_05430 [Proteobacteria bacterium]|nr:hypothetical protein [Pseudomonadota bacterium]